MQDQNTAEMAWATGVLEGEGGFDAIIGTRPGGGVARTLRIRLGMTDKDTVYRFAEILGCGHIREVPPERDGYRPSWEWAVADSANLVRLLPLLWPWLGARRRASAMRLIPSLRAVTPRGGQRAADFALDPMIQMPDDRDLRLAWATGFVEAEGCFDIQSSTRSPHGKRYWFGRITVNSTDDDVLSRLPGILGCGRLSKPIPPGPYGTKPYRSWVETKPPQLDQIIPLLLPHLSLRRAAAANRVLDLAREQLHRRALRVDTSEGSKICTKCGIEKPLPQFSRRTAADDGHQGWCKSCLAAQGRAYRAGESGGHVRRLDHGLIVTQFAAGMALRELAALHGCNEGSVDRIVRAALGSSRR